ncbi:MAG: cytochrome c [Candidatus Marinimicrobia bacterium]|nr:cytochrome c [Candidatus Neomarinimicrobiota bacterium]MCF7829498.1 cytochrome c [Candidatus Neomarinimicrobiota bacterium]MCF7880104.1 cytochrome c [Candidatus Neomarinimicrobiota bacterium]
MKQIYKIPVWFAIFILAASVVSCGGEKEKNFSDAPLTDTQLKHGIGPIDTVKVGNIDIGLVRRGQSIFRAECMKCHTMDKAVLGPALRNITERRTPEFIMNMILNPQENVMRHPVLQKYHQQFNQYMTDVGLDSSGARAVLEYLRSEAPE